LLFTLCHAASSVCLRYTLSIRLNHFPPLTPFSSAANMRSLHTVASTHVHFPARVSAPCLALAGTTDAWLSLCHSVSLTLLPSCLPSLGAALLSALLATARRCGTMKALTPAPLTYGAALPAYFATPSCRSASNHVGCLIIAFHHASVISVFRTSPWNRWLVAAPRRIEFVILRTDSSPRVAPHPVSRRRSYLRLRSLWLSPTRTFTVLMWRPHGRTHSRARGKVDSHLKCNRSWQKTSAGVW